MESYSPPSLEGDDTTFYYLLSVFSGNFEERFGENELKEFIKISESRITSLAPYPKYRKEASTQYTTQKNGTGAEKQVVEAVARMLDIESSEIARLYDYFMKYEIASKLVHTEGDLVKELLRYHFFLEQCRVKCITAIYTNPNSNMYKALTKSLNSARIDSLLVKYLRYIREKPYTEVYQMEMLEIVNSSTILLQYDILTALYTAYICDDALSCDLEELLDIFRRFIFDREKRFMNLDKLAKSTLDKVDIAAVMIILEILDKYYDVSSSQQDIDTMVNEVGSQLLTMVSRRMKVVHLAFATLLQTMQLGKQSQEFLRISLEGENALSVIQSMLESPFFYSEEDEAKPMAHTLFTLLTRLHSAFDCMLMPLQLFSMIFECFISILRINEGIVDERYTDIVFVDIFDTILSTFPINFSLVLDFLTAVSARKSSRVMQRFNRLGDYCVWSGPEDMRLDQAMTLNVCDILSPRKVAPYSGWAVLLEKLLSFNDIPENQLISLLGFLRQVAKYHDITVYLNKRTTEGKKELVGMLWNVVKGLPPNSEFKYEAIELILHIHKELGKVGGCSYPILKSLFVLEGEKGSNGDKGRVEVLDLTDNFRGIARILKEPGTHALAAAFLEMLYQVITFSSYREFAGDKLVTLISDGIFARIFEGSRGAHLSHWKLGHHCLSFFQHIKLSCSVRRAVILRFASESSLYIPLFRFCMEDPEDLRKLIYSGAVNEAKWLEKSLRISLLFLLDIVDNLHIEQAAPTRIDSAFTLPITFHGQSFDDYVGPDYYGSKRYSVGIDQLADFHNMSIYQGSERKISPLGALATHATFPWKLEMPTICNKILSLYMIRNPHSPISKDYFPDNFLPLMMTRFAFYEDINVSGGAASRATLSDLRKYEGIRSSTLELVASSLRCENALPIYFLGNFRESDVAERSAIASLVSALSDTKLKSILFRETPKLLYHALRLVYEIRKMRYGTENEYSRSLDEVLMVDKSMLYLSDILRYGEELPETIRERRTNREAMKKELEMDEIEPDGALRVIDEDKINDMEPIRTFCYQKAVKSVVLDIFTIEEDIPKLEFAKEQLLSANLRYLSEAEAVADFAAFDNNMRISEILHDEFGTDCDGSNSRSSRFLEYGVEHVIKVESYYKSHVFDDYIHEKLRQEANFARWVNVEISVADSEMRLFLSWMKFILRTKERNQSKFKIDFVEKVASQIERTIFMYQPDRSIEKDVERYLREISKLFLLCIPLMEEDVDGVGYDCYYSIVGIISKCIRMLIKEHGSDEYRFEVVRNLSCSVHVFFRQLEARKVGITEQIEIEAISILKSINAVVRSVGFNDMTISAFLSVFSYLGYSEKCMQGTFEESPVQSSFFAFLMENLSSLRNKEHVLQFLTVIIPRCRLFDIGSFIDAIGSFDYRKSRATWIEVIEIFVLLTKKTTAETNSSLTEEILNFVLENIAQFRAAVDSLVEELSKRPMSAELLAKAMASGKESLVDLVLAITSLFAAEVRMKLHPDYSALKAAESFTPSLLGLCSSLIPYIRYDDTVGDEGKQISLKIHRIVRNCVAYLRNFVPTEGEKVHVMGVFPFLAFSRMSPQTGPLPSGAQSISLSIDDMISCVRFSIHVATKLRGRREKVVLYDIIDSCCFCVIYHLLLCIQGYRPGRRLELTSMAKNVLDQVGRDSDILEYFKEYGSSIFEHLSAKLTDLQWKYTSRDTLSTSYQML